MVSSLSFSERIFIPCALQQYNIMLWKRRRNTLYAKLNRHHAHVERSLSRWSIRSVQNIFQRLTNEISIPFRLVAIFSCLPIVVLYVTKRVASAVQCRPHCACRRLSWKENCRLSWTLDWWNQLWRLFQPSCRQPRCEFFHGYVTSS